MGQNVAPMQQSDAGKGSVTEKVQSYAPGTRRKRNPIQQAADLTIKAMLVQGASIRKVAAALNISPTTVSRVKARICEQSPDAEDLKSGLMSPHLGKMSVAVVEHFLKKGATLRVIKGSDAMAAVKAVQDRQCPIPGDAPAPSRTFVVSNLNIFLPDSQPAPQDAPIGTTCSVLEDGKQTREKNLNQFNTCSVP